MNVSLIIAAGGSSQRFLKGRKPKEKFSKLFVPLGEKPLLTRTIESFHGIPQIKEIIVAVPRGTESRMRTHVLNGCAVPRVRIVPGGATRAESVWKALTKASPRSDWVLVHDGARPFPPKPAIQDLLRKKPSADGVILTRPVVPTIKRVGPGGRILGTVDRTNLFEAETPQLVRRSVLVKAYRENPLAFSATDESSLVESVGGRVKVHPHTGWNVKVTNPEDLKLAEAVLSVGATRRAAPTVTIGFGRDTHRLVAGRKLFLGGVRIPFEKGALGHSDGDALLHAVSDAVLGAIGAGDIGEWFSDRNARNKNIRSEKILRRVVGEAKRKGWAAAHLDSVVTLERPRLGIYKGKIRRKLAKLTGLGEEFVSVKAKTQEGLGPEGQGLAVTCEAVVLMKRTN